MDMVDMDIGHGIHGHGGHGHDVHGHGGHGFICQFWVQVCCSEMFYSAFLPFFAAKRACGSNFQEFCLNDDVKIFFVLWGRVPKFSTVHFLPFFCCHMKMSLWQQLL